MRAEVAKSELIIMDGRQEDLTESQRLLASTSSDSERSTTPPERNNLTDKDYIVKSEETTMLIPIDKFNIVYVIFYVLGLGTLLPWNFFITADDYWKYKLRENITDDEPIHAAGPSSNGTYTTNLQSLFQNALSICAMLPNVIFQFLNTVLQQRINERIRMIGTLVIMILLFVFTEVLVKIDTSTWQHTFFAVTLVTVIILNCNTAVFQSSLFGMAANLPSRYTQAIMAGQGMGGVFAALAMIAALSFSSDPTSSAFAYFLTAIVVLVITGISYLTLTKNKFYCHFIKGDRTKNESKNVAINSEHQSLRKLSSSDDEKMEKEQVWVRRNSLQDDKKDHETPDVMLVQPKIVPPLLTIFKKIWLHCFCVMFIFFITLACFPSITASVKSMTQDTVWNTLYFTPVTCFLLFNVGDWLGRTISGRLHFPSEKNTCILVILVLARGAFPILFALCNAQPRTAPVVFSNDAYFIVFIILFSVSNGYLSTLSMQYGPRKVSPEHAVTAGSMLAFSMAIGLAAGAGFSFVVKMAI